MDLLGLAIQSTVHSTETSAAELAEKLGLGYQVFINKVNPHNDTHKLSLYEAVALMLHSKNPSIHYALRDSLRKAGVIDRYDEKPLIPAILDAAAETGDVDRVVRDALIDGYFTDREKLQVISEARQAIEV